MPARIPEESLAAIEQAVAQHPDGASFGEVAAAVPERVADRTLQYRLRYLVDKGRLNGLLEAIPVRVIMNDKTALLGAARVAALQAGMTLGA